MKETPIISLRNVCKTFKTQAGDVPALRNVNADFNPGQFSGIIGKSGAGKSTLVNMISGVDRITSGEIFILNNALHQMKEDQIAQWRGKNIGVVYQSFELLSQLSLLDNVLLPMELTGSYNPLKSRKLAQELLEQVELGAHIHKPPTMISGGQQQRAAIARALANDPPIIIADEPTGNLDSKTGETILNLFKQLVSQGKTILMVTHDQNLHEHFDQLLYIKDGELSQKK